MKSTDFIFENSRADKALAQISSLYKIEPSKLDIVRDIAKKARLSLVYIEPLVRIAKDCSWYLEEAGDLSLGMFRGIQVWDHFIEKKVRLKGRESLTGSADLKDPLNEYFIKKFGSPFRDSAMCTGSLGTVKSFGNVYIIFPVGDYSFLWSPDIEDVNASFSNFVRNFDGKKSDVYDEFIKDIDGNNRYNDENIQAAIKSKNEIMLRCDSYYGLELKDIEDNLETIKEILKVLS